MAQPGWVHHQGIILELARVVSGLDFLRLCCTCKPLRAYQSRNRKLAVTVNHDHPLVNENVRMQLPAGTTEVMIWIKSLNIHVTFPDTVKHIGVTISEKNPEEGWKFPEGLKSLRLSSGYIRILPMDIDRVVLPENLVSLHLSKCRYTRTHFPETLIHMSLMGVSRSFDPYIPPTIVNLSLQLKAKNLGGAKRTLNFSGLINLRELKLDVNYSLVFFVAPPNLRKFTFTSSTWNQSIEGWNLPDELEYLRIDAGIKKKPETNLPKGLKELDLNLHSMHTGEEFYHTWMLPAGVKKLTLGPFFLFRVVSPGWSWKLPEGLEELKMDSWFDEPVVGWMLPESLKRIDLGDHFTQPVRGWVLPRNLEHLRVGYDFVHDVTGMIPTSDKVCVVHGTSQTISWLHKTQ